MGSDLEFYLGIGGCLLFILVVFIFGESEEKIERKREDKEKQ